MFSKKHRSGVVDLPMESREAKHKEIYIAVEEYPSFDTPLPEIGWVLIVRIYNNNDLLYLLLK